MVIKEEKFKEDILRLYEEHGNGGLIAKELGITNYRVYKCLRANGIEPKKVGGKEKYSAEKMIGMYESGMSVAQVAKKLNMAPSSVWERLKNHGMQFTTKSTATRGREKEIIEMYQSGESSSIIAEKIGLKSKDGVLRLLRKYNIPARDMYGPNNHAWKGGRIEINKLIRNSAKYIEFRDRIMRERDYTCEVSGERGGKLNVHHIFKMSQLIDQFLQSIDHDILHPDRREELYRAIEDFDKFWDPNNVMVVTEEIHREIHSNDKDIDS